MGRRGFSLIELMVVIAIVALLAAIGAPVLNEYTAHTHVSKWADRARGIATKMTDYYERNGTWPDAETIGLPASSGSIVNVGTYGVSPEVWQILVDDGTTSLCGSGTGLGGRIRIMIDPDEIGLNSADQTGGGIWFGVTTWIFEDEGLIKTSQVVRMHNNDITNEVYSHPILPYGTHGLGNTSMTQDVYDILQPQCP